MNVLVNPIFPIRDRKPEAGRVQSVRVIDSKVQGLVLARICDTRGGLLPSAASPQVVIDLLPVFDSVKMQHQTREKKRARPKRALLTRKAPIGLRPVDSEGWLNALMQFILFVPGFIELFFFAPRSFSPFREFIDQYILDQQDNCSISSANGSALFRFLAIRLPRLSLQEIFQFLIHTLHPKWEIHKTIEQALKKGVMPDIFITESSMKKQFFTDPETHCYDLDAFIELRPDGPSVSFITYVKLEGIWYQCDDDRITQMRSNNLNIPLHRAILLHYRRIDFGRKY